MNDQKMTEKDVLSCFLSAMKSQHMDGAKMREAMLEVLLGEPVPTGSESRPWTQHTGEMFLSYETWKAKNPMVRAQPTTFYAGWEMAMTLIHGLISHD